MAFVPLFSRISLGADVCDKGFARGIEIIFYHCNEFKVNVVTAIDNLCVYKLVVPV